MQASYKLVAQNSNGATVTFDAATIKKCLDNFDAQYSRSGFKIYVERNDHGIIVKTIKKTYR